MKSFEIVRTTQTIFHFKNDGSMETVPAGTPVFFWPDSMIAVADGITGPFELQIGEFELIDDDEIIVEHIPRSLVEGSLMKTITFVGLNGPITVIRGSDITIDVENQLMMICDDFVEIQRDEYSIAS